MHLIGMLMVFFPLGGLLVYSANGGLKKNNVWRAKTAATHGLGLLLSLVGGFGMIAKLQGVGFPAWAWIKLAIWLALGGVTVMIAKKPELAKVLWLVILALGFIAITLGIYHVEWFGQ